jgi:AsmA protein
MIEAHSEKGAHMRTVKILAGLVGGIVVLFVAALLAVWLLVNPNDYKGRIAAAVKESTGRELILTGDIKLSVFPWVALGLGPASLGNPPGFGSEPFLAFQHAAVRVRLFPLLAKQLDMDRVELDGLDARLIKNAQGVGNWENFGKADKGKAGAEGNSSGSLVGLAGIAVTHGRVSYQGMVVQNINLETGASVGSGVTPVSLTLDANRGVAGESVTLNAKFDLSGDLARKRLKLEAVNFNGLLSQPGDGRPAHWELHAPTIDLDLIAQTAGVPAFDGGYSVAHVSGKLEATHIIDDLSATGSVALAPVVLRELAPRLGVALPKTRDPRAFAQLAAGSDFSYGSGGVQLEKLQVTLDDTHLKGSVAWVGEPRVVKFALTVDEMDVNRYLPVESGGAAGGAAVGAAAAGSPGKGSAADGTLTVASLHFAPLEFSNVRLTLASKDGVAHLFPSLAQIDGGSYSGNITVDARAAVPSLSLDEHLSGVDVAQLVAGTSYKGRVSGRGNVNLKASARGAALDGVMQTLSGHFDANLVNGALEGVDLGYVIGQAQALLNHGTAPAESRPPRTKFDAFKLTAEIINGVAKPTDLTISSPVLKLTGQGSASLVNRGIDFQMMASVLKAPGTSVADIPVKVSGTYLDPSFKPDVEALAKGALKDKIQDVLKKNGLEGLFGK